MTWSACSGGALRGAALVVPLVVTACSAAPPAEPQCGGAEAEVELRTSDGEVLIADWRPAAVAGAPAVVLLHMVPPSWDRSSWPGRVRRELGEAGWGVLTVDRRGAGQSTGEARDAYEGEGGRLDVEAAVAFLLGVDCAVDPDRLGLVGASNGTTPVNDYANGRDAELPAAAANVFMSPGTYTENQFVIDPSVDLGRPLLWLYPTNEPWSGAFLEGAPSGWRFVERGEVHGTQMLDGGELEAETVGELTAFFGEAFGR